MTPLIYGYIDELVEVDMAEGKFTQDAVIKKNPGDTYYEHKQYPYINNDPHCNDNSHQLRLSN